MGRSEGLQTLRYSLLQSSALPPVSKTSIGVCKTCMRQMFCANWRDFGELRLWPVGEKDDGWHGRSNEERSILFHVLQMLRTQNAISHKTARAGVDFSILILEPLYRTCVECPLTCHENVYVLRRRLNVLSDACAAAMSASQEKGAWGSWTMPDIAQGEEQ